MRVFENPSDLAALVGQEVAISPWMTIDQARVNQFAAATDDYQWIHVDPERAAQSPLGGTIAHGFLTLSLLPTLLEQSITINNIEMGINYGLNRVRFIAPVLVGSQIRSRWLLMDVNDMGHVTQYIWQATIEQDDSSKPCCVAEWIGRITKKRA